MYGFRGQLWGAGDKDQILGLVRNAGFGYFGQQARWEVIEPSQGSYDFGELDSIVNAAQASGVDLVLNIAGAPTWARQNVQYPYPKNPADFENFMRALATRYAGKVRGYELLNEANVADEVGPGNFNACTFAELLRAGNRGVKSADPHAFTISGALTPTGVMGDAGWDDVDYLRKLYACLGGQGLPADYLGAHANEVSNPPWDTPQKNTTGNTNYIGHGSFYLSRLLELQAVMRANGDNKRIYVTEGGWTSSPNPHPRYAFAASVTEEQQAAWLVEGLRMAKDWGIAGWLVWNLNYCGQANPEDNLGFCAYGVLRRDNSARPAYEALKNMAK